MLLPRATAIANRIAEMLTPHCEVLHIAGSVRRQKPEVKDIEVVCIPKKEQADLFGTEMVTIPAFSQAIDAMAQSIVKGNVNGRMMQVALRGKDTINPVMLDLFMPQPADFYRQLAIRTGSSLYSNLVIATAWKAKGWCGTPDGLRRREECDEKEGKEGKSTFTCIAPTPTLPPVWASEREFFDWLGINWVQPHLREILSQQNLAR